jgi:pyruvate dehydrogenase E2 component (dihydrolipoamide acetyltransferase)
LSLNELLHIGIPEGETAPVDSLLAIIGKEGEDISALLAEGEATATEDSKEKSTDEVQRRYKTRRRSTKSAALPKELL